MREWHAKRALTSACVIALVGDANPDHLAELAARAFGELRRVAANPVLLAGLALVERDGEIETAIARRRRWHSCSRADRDRIPRASRRR